MTVDRLHFGTTRQARAWRWFTRADCTHESLAAYLADCTGQPVDRSTVSRWANGTRSVDAEAWFLALEHAGDNVCKVLDALASEFNCVVVRLPSPAPGARPGLSRRALLLSGLAGRIAELVAEASDPESDGGAEITEAERESIREVERQLARILATPAQEDSGR